MMAGHFATALIADQRFHKSGTLFYFLVASQLPDLLWHVFHFVGLESTTPEHIVDVSLKNLQVDMLFSHDLVPTIFWMGVVFMAGLLIFKSNIIGLVGAALHGIHIGFDYLGGYPHRVFGPDTPLVGIPLYPTVPLVSVAIEAVVSAILVGYFFWRERQMKVSRSSGSRWAIVGFFVFNILFLFTIAEQPLSQVFDLPEDLRSAMTLSMPNLVLTYWGMLFFLLYFVSRNDQEPVTQVE